MLIVVLVGSVLAPGQWTLQGQLKHCPLDSPPAWGAGEPQPKEGLPLDAGAPALKPSPLSQLR